MTKKETPKTDGEKKFEENPYNPENKKPEDVVRLFYKHNVPIIPVISKRGGLLGILKKEDVISELSDIERVEKLTIDKFITKVASKMTFDNLLQYGKIKEFVVLNIFGEIQGTWTRLHLFGATETEKKQAAPEVDVEKQREEQILEWMIYLILEHIPRPLYALNEKNKTIFYNSYFEELYEDKFAKEVETKFVESSLKNADKNQLIAGLEDEEIYFLNTDMNILYEKIPLMSKDKRVGFLIFCLNNTDQNKEFLRSSSNAKEKSLQEIVDSFEHQLIDEKIKEFHDLGVAAENLKITKKTLSARIKKYDIKI